MKRTILVTALAMILSIAFFALAQRMEGRASASNANSLLLGAVSIDDVSMDEGTGGTTNMVFRVTVTGSHTNTIGVNYSTANGEATAPSDYTSTSNQLVFDGTAEPTITKTISVPIIGDTDVEPNETFVVNLEIVDSSATLGDGQGVGTIRNDDVPCTYLLNPTSASFSDLQTTGGVEVETLSACSWTATSNASWITITSAESGTGPGLVHYSVALNTGEPRTGTMTIAGQTFTVNQQVANACSFFIQPTTANFPATGGDGSLDMRAPTGCTWTASSNVSWIAVTSSSSGSGDVTVNYTVLMNEGVSRTGTLTIGGETFTVNQLASGNCPSSIAPSLRGFPANGGTASVAVTTGAACSWAAVSNDDWISITSGASGTGNRTLNYSVAANAGSPRSGTLTIAGQTFQVQQQSTLTSCTPPSLRTPLTREFSASGGPDRGGAFVPIGCNWTAVSNDPWITITLDRSANQPGNFSYLVTPNTSVARTGTISVIGEAGTATYTINQQEAGRECAYSLTPTSVDIPYSLSEFSGEVRVDAQFGCEWSAVSHSPWIQIVGSFVTDGIGWLSYRATRNTGVDRTGTMTIAGQTFTVRQVRCPVTIETTTSEPFSYLGGIGTIESSSDHCALTVTSNDPWITIRSVPGEFNDGTIEYQVAENTGPIRTGTITINDLTFTVTQFGAGVCSFSIGRTSEQFSAVGTGYNNSHATLDVAAPPGCAWSANQDVPWIHIESGSTGSGNGSVVYTVDTNMSPLARYAFLRIRESGSAKPYPDQVLSISQRGTLPPCVQEVSPAYQAFDGNLNYFTVNVIAPPDCRWEPIKEAPWISMEVESTFVRHGNGSVDYHVNENPGGQRSAVIDFGGKLHTITQGVDACPIRALCRFFPSQCPDQDQARSFRDGVLAKTSRGKRYTQLYYKFSTEAVGIMMLNPMLILRSREVMQRYMPVVQRMVRGEQVTLTEGEIEEIDGFLRSFAEKGGPEFREALRGLREDLRNPQVHSEFKITVSEGAKRELSENSGLNAIKEASLMIGPVGLCLFVFLRMKLGRSRTRKPHLKRLLWVAIPFAVVGVQLPVVNGQSPVGGVRWAVTSGASRLVSARDLIVPNIAGKYRTARNTRTRQLRIEAVPAYSSYFGGSKNEEGNSIAVDSAGNIYVAGFTDSTNFPLVNASQPTFGGGQQDAFIVKLDPSGAHVLYSTYIGGNGQDNATSIAVDSGGNAYLTGFTDSTNFPVSNAFQPANRGSFNAFVVKLDPAGAIINSTLFGGSVSDYGSSIAVDSAGNVYLAGLATSPDIPTANALQSTLGGLVDIFVAKINPSGTGLIYSTYLGAGGIDGASSIAVDSAANLYVTGLTSSLNFTTLNPLQATHGGGAFDAFVVKVNSSGTQIVYSTFLGGSGEDRSFRIAVDSSGSAYVTGDTDSTNFPLLNALQPIKGGSADAFVAKLNPAGNQLVYSTYLGGSGIEGGTAIAVDSAGGACLAGFTASTNFPTMNPLQANLAGAYDGFVAKLNPSGSALNSSTYLGGSSTDSVFGTAVDSSANAYVMGVTDSTNFPTANAFQGTNGGGTADVFIAKLAGQSPTAAPASISGQVTTSDGVPLAGVTVLLDGPRSAIRITNSAGRYSFLDLETGGFYTLTPERANYIFSPVSRSFSLLSNKTDVAFTALAIAPTANPLDTSPEFFVRQQYLDFLNREPDQSGLAYWSAQIRQCNGDAQCIRKKRIDVSNAFFYELEFQETGAYVYRMYKAAFGTLPAAPHRANLTYAQFMPDRSRVVGGPQLDATKTDFANEFVLRSAFTGQYPGSMTAAQYVDALNANTGNLLTPAQGDILLSGLQIGTETRGSVLRKVADNTAFIEREYNASFVLTQYFGYLRRDPDQSGFDFWLDRVNRFPVRDVSIQHAMVCSFITSGEYQERFGAIVSHSNQECQQ